MSNFQIAIQMCQIYKLPNEMVSVQLCHGDFLTTKIPKIMALHLAAIQNNFDFTVLMIKRYTEIQFNG
jgi:hypothetical protein